MITTIIKEDITTLYGDNGASVVVTTFGNIGPQGPPGDGDLSSYFLIANKFSELDTDQKKADARSNLQLQNIDCGEFF